MSFLRKGGGGGEVEATSHCSIFYEVFLRFQGQETNKILFSAAPGEFSPSSSVTQEMTFCGSTHAVVRRCGVADVHCHPQRSTGD